MGEKFLIINADDFGMCHAENMATIDLFEKGGISSATVMTPCSWAVEAMKWVRQNPQFSVGVHLTLTSEWGGYRWGPVGREGTESLRDDLGYMYDENEYFEENCDIDEVEKEIYAQVGRFRSFGVEPTHLDNHMGGLYGLHGNNELMPKTFEICGKLGLPFRLFKYIDMKNLPGEFPKGISMEFAQKMVDSLTAAAAENGVKLIDYMIFPKWNEETESDYSVYREAMLDCLSNIREGMVTETFIHPAFECDELKAITARWKTRVWEHKLFADPATRQHLEAHGVKYINYLDLVKM